LKKLLNPRKNIIGVNLLEMKYGKTRQNIHWAMPAKRQLGPARPGLCLRTQKRLLELPEK
jgi:hypothetical protein